MDGYHLVFVALTGLEILVAFLQAYVFAILTCIYLNDAQFNEEQKEEKWS